VINVVEKDTQKQHAVLSKKQWHLLERKLRTEVISGKRKKAKNIKPFSAAATSSKQDDTSIDEDDKDKKAFMKSVMAPWKSPEKDKKSQKHKRKRSDNDTSDYKQKYSMSSQTVALKPNRSKIGNPTT
jgi:hypothetical protein